MPGLQALTACLATVVATATCVPEGRSPGKEPAQAEPAGAVVLLPFSKDGLWGFMNTQFKPVVPAQYDSVMDFSEGLAAVWKDAKLGFVDTKGKVAIPLQFEEAGDFSEGLVAVAKGEKVGYIDKTGKFVIEPRFDPVPDLLPLHPFKGGLALVAKGEKVGYINKSGQWVINPTFDYGEDYSEGYAVVLKGEDSFFIDTKGARAFGSRKAVSGFSEGLAAFWENRKAGVIDRTGKVVIPAQKFDLIREFHGGFAQAIVDGKLGFIDKTGSWIIQPQYHAYNDSDEPPAGNFSEGLVWVQRDSDGLCGYLDKSGKTVIPFQFTNANDFEHGLAFVGLEEGYAYIDKSGKILWRGEY